MNQKEYYISSDGLEKLKAEYSSLKENDWPAALDRISKARELGNLEDNPEFDAASKAKDIIEGRMLELEEIIEYAVVMDGKEKMVKGKVTIGSTVTVEVEGSHQTFTIVGSVEADPTQGKISHESPVGQQLLGLKEGDIVEIKLPKSNFEYKVLKIHR